MWREGRERDGGGQPAEFTLAEWPRVKDAQKFQRQPTAT